MARRKWSRVGDCARRTLAVVVAGAALVVPAGRLIAQTPQHVQSLAEEAIRRLGLQTSFPVVPEPFRFSLKLPGEVLWLVIAVGLAVLLYAFRDLIPILRSQQSGDWDNEEAGAGGGRARTPAAALGAADQLAAEQRFVEAMHVLLLQSLTAIRDRLDEPFSDSLTSREILRSGARPASGKRALRDMVNRVEWTYFGSYPAALSDYVACRASFNALALTLNESALA